MPPFHFKSDWLRSPHRNQRTVWGTALVMQDAASLLDRLQIKMLHKPRIPSLLHVVLARKSNNQQNRFLGLGGCCQLEVKEPWVGRIPWKSANESGMLLQYSFMS